jgi:SAM-dependent methyltransferase
LPLARLGNPVDVVELTPEFTEQIQAVATAEGLAINITQGDILDPLVQMRPAYYQLAVVAEVVSHFRTLEQVRLLLAKMCEVLRPGGLLLLNSFLAVDDYEPDQLVQQMSQVNWSYIMTRSDLTAAMDQLPLEILSDESALEYERSHQRAEAWPPTGWFVNWAAGRDLFGFDNIKPPMELRWLLFKRL